MRGPEGTNQWDAVLAELAEARAEVERLKAEKAHPQADEIMELFQTFADNCEAAFADQRERAMQAEAKLAEMIYQSKAGYPSVEEVGVEGLRQYIKNLEAKLAKVVEALKRDAEVECFCPTVGWECRPCNARRLLVILATKL